jgi:hypothetical protein
MKKLKNIKRRSKSIKIQKQRKNKISESSVLRMRTIEMLIINSVEYRCENIDYKLTHSNHVVVWSVNFHNDFYSTSLITKMSSFNSYLTIEDNRIELHIY